MAYKKGLSVNCSDGDDQNNPIVQIKNGPVRGVRSKLSNGKFVNTFYSIRYGRAERFALPKPNDDKWGDDDVYDATKLRSACPQWDIFHEQSEDCLFLNVYQPASSDNNVTNAANNNSEALKPVMVFIFGGGFTLGNIDFFPYDGSFIASMGDVIVISMNYRLGPFGFLYLDDDDMPGNQGLHDQILSLKWIRENVENFGGDPNQITLFGESAGSMSISALLISPLAKGLFHRAILHSGTLIPLPMFGPNNTKQLTIEFAKSVGCASNYNQRLIECLRKKPVAELILFSDGLNLVKIFQGKLPFIMYEDKFGLVPDKPYNLIQKKQENLNIVDILLGFNHDELGQVSALLVPDVLNPIGMHTLNGLQKVLKNLGKQFDLPKYEQAIELYTKDLPLFPSVAQYRRTIIDFISDPIMICPSYLWAKHWSKLNNSSVNVWDFRLEKHSPWMTALGCLKWMGVCHGMDVPYLFGLPLNWKFLGKFIFTNDDKLVSKSMIKSWTNFAKTGHPGKFNDQIEWPSTKFDDIKLMSIKARNSKFEIVSNAYQDKCENFWEQFFYPNNNTTQ